MLACLRTLVLAQFRDSESDPVPVSRDGRLTQAWSKRFPRTKRQLLGLLGKQSVLFGAVGTVRIEAWKCQDGHVGQPAGEWIHSRKRQIQEWRRAAC